MGTRDEMEAILAKSLSFPLISVYLSRAGMCDMGANGGGAGGFGGDMHGFGGTVRGFEGVSFGRGVLARGHWDGWWLEWRIGFGVLVK